MIYPMLSARPRRQSASSSRMPRRSGAVLVAVLACILITVALVGGAMKSTLTSRRQCKLELHMQQAELLLLAGIDRIHQARMSSTEPTDALEPMATWDARTALDEFAIAEVSFERIEIPGMDPQVRCTARLGVSPSPEQVIQLSRDISLNQHFTSNNTQSNKDGDSSDVPK